jgi:autotransporter-associated beta strand protein
MTATFNGGGNGHTTIDLSGTAVVINTIAFDTSSAAAYTIGSGAVNSQSLSLNNGGAITMSSTVAANQLFNATIFLGAENKSNAAFTFTNDSLTNTLTFAGTIQASNNATMAAGTKTLTLNGAGNGVISGVIQNGTATGAVIKSGTGTWTLTGANTYTGATTISAGTLQLGNGGTAGSLSTSSTITDNGTFKINRSNAVSQGTDFSGSAITGTGSLVQAGSGTTTLTAANTYSGGTTVTAGTLLVNNTTGSGTGSGSVTVNGSGTTLGGTGTISGSVTLGNTTPGAILNPGPKGTAGTSASVGTLTTGAVTLTGANTVHIDAFGTLATQWDKLVSTGAISLGTTSTLQVIIASGLTFTSGTTYHLLTGTSLTGTFSGITNNELVLFSGYEFIAEYTPTEFDLVVPVPEPGTWCAAALALGVAGYSQRRRFGRLLKSA